MIWVRWNKRSKCDNSCNINEEYGPHKIIDPIILNDRNYVKNIGLELKIYTLENVTTKKYNKEYNKKYILKGNVNYLDNARHYIALHTNVKWYE